MFSLSEISLLVLRKDRHKEREWFCLRPSSLSSYSPKVKVQFRLIWNDWEGELARSERWLDLETSRDLFFIAAGFDLLSPKL
ncbi:hypothetical protein CEXT_427541 [Caerostris extrusa]|uniref:Uncharacterized protein n=1 Tax=Caerostris extrusa TaxID=172846 RepID=A0AAV4PZX6_CAEEX|nr:hypothetical protein CEXT_427541 [Caerostris extrusa]